MKNIIKMFQKNKTPTPKEKPIIGNPKNFKHGYHVKSDFESGVLTNIPSEWSGIIGGAEVDPNETKIDDNLRISDKDVKKFKNKQIQGLAVSKPSSFSHDGHLEYNKKVKEIVGYGDFKDDMLIEEFENIGIKSAKDLDEFKKLLDNWKEIGNQESEKKKSMKRMTKRKRKFLNDYLKKDDPNNLFKDLINLEDKKKFKIFNAVNKDDDKLVTIQVINIDKNVKIADLTNQISVMDLLSSKHGDYFVKYISSYNQKMELWIVCESIKGTTMVDILEKTTFDENEIAAIAINVLNILKLVHSHNILFRDIKSDNIVINAKGKIKLKGYDYCRELSSKKEKRKSVKGSPYWLAPEVIRSKLYSFPCDIWSFGVLLLELADGEPPYLELPPLRALLQIATNSSPTLEDESGWSTEFIDFLSLTLDKDPNKRGTIDDLLSHPFLSSKPSDTSFLTKLIKKYKLIRDV